MNKSPAFQWYPKDILASARVQMMTLAEEGAYRRLLDFCWINGSIPSDAGRAARLVGKGCSVETVKAALEMFMPDPSDADKLIHDRLEVEREKQAGNSEVRKAAAKARWNKRGTSENGNGKQVKSKTDANAMQTDMQKDALHISSSSSIAKEKEKTTEAVVKKKAATAALTEKLIDEDFLSSLETNPAYKHLSVRLEFEKAKIWCAANKRVPTKKFFVNWINRIQPTLEATGANTNGSNKNGNGKYPARRTDADVIRESADFYANYPN